MYVCIYVCMRGMKKQRHQKGLLVGIDGPSVNDPNDN